MHPRILVVDDDPNLLQGIRSRLHGRYDIEVAQGGQQALARLAEEPTFSVIICDFRMPGMDGIEILTRVRDEFPQLVRLMLTGHGDMQVAAAAINAGGIFKMRAKATRRAAEVLRQQHQQHEQNLALEIRVPIRIAEDLIAQDLPSEIRPAS
jgi:CheY-like chemotaxis protein